MIVLLTNQHSSWERKTIFNINGSFLKIFANDNEALGYIEGKIFVNIVCATQNNNMF